MLLPVVLFDDIELWCTTKLRAALADRSEPYASDVFVSNKVPNPRRNRMVIFRRDGGPRLDAVREAPRLGINVWAKTDQDAGDLARLTAALLWASPDGDPVSKVTITGGPYAIAEESTSFRHYFTAELTAKGRDA